MDTLSELTEQQEAAIVRLVAHKRKAQREKCEYKVRLCGQKIREMAEGVGADLEFWRRVNSEAVTVLREMMAEDRRRREILRRAERWAASVNDRRGESD